MNIDKIISGKLDNNTYVVSNNKNECIIIDASCSVSELKKYTENKKVLGLFLTHGHYDHFINLDNILAEYTDIKCYIFKTELEKLYSPKLNYSIVFNTFFASKLQEDRFEKLEDRQTIELSDFKIEVFLTKGHTDGCVCYLVNGECLFTGDTLFSGSYGRTDLLTGDYAQMQNSLSFIKKNFKGFTFYAGHGEDGIVKPQS